VRLPLLLARGEARRVSLALPEAASIPEGFVYVPPGRFLYGCLSSEEQRAFFGAEPQHAIETGAYLIAQRETTYAEWIAFLRDLPPDERLQRAPSMHRQGFTVALAELPDGDFKLTLGPDKTPYAAKMGQPIVYPGRHPRAEHDWQRFPVSAVSFEDGQAYVAWLARTGRVPGARLCDEREWERAARGADGRLFPGGAQLEPGDANFDLTYGRDPEGYGPDEVGAHPASDSPIGVQDLAGNVWEWVSSAHRPDQPVGRGGSFFQAAIGARTENREPFASTHKDAFVGIRICATHLPPPQE
jgi:formylglycine-generating enzyme required for sulfatase activity